MSSSILSHDMQPRDPYGPETTDSASPKFSSSVSDLASPTRFRYKSALTHQEPGPPPGAYLAQFNFDGTPKLQRSPSAASTVQQTVDSPQGPSSFYSGLPNEQPKPRPRGQFGAMVDTRVEEKQRMRQELAYYEQLQRTEREQRRSSASSANLDPPSNYFPFGQEQPKARISSDLVQRPPPVSSNEVRQGLQAAMREQLQQREDAKRQEREQRLNHVESGLIPVSSQRASARIKNRFSDGRWDGPPPNMSFGTGGGGAPNYDPNTGQIRTSLPVSLVPQVPLSVHDPNVAAAQNHYRAMLDYQRMLAAAHQQQQQQFYLTHEPGLSFVANPQAPMDPTARFPLSHTDVVKPEGGPFTLGASGPTVHPARRSRRASASAAGAEGVRPAGFDLPVVYPNTFGAGATQQPPPSCFYLGLPNANRTLQRRQRSQSELGPTTEHGKELQRDPRLVGTDVTRYQEALIRDAQTAHPGVVYHQESQLQHHFYGQDTRGQAHAPVQPQPQPQRQPMAPARQPAQQQCSVAVDAVAKTPAGTLPTRSRRASRQSQYSVPRARSMPGPS